MTGIILNYLNISTLLLLLTAFQSNAQNSIEDTLKPAGDTLEAGDDRVIENLIESQTTDAEDSKLLDELTKLEAEPLDINTASEKDLEKIPFISGIVSKNIIHYRKKHKKFVSISELKLIYGIDKDLYKKITRFLIVPEDRNSYRKDEFGKTQKIQQTGLNDRFNFRMRNRLTNELQPSRGFLDTVYTGTRPKVYNRAEMKYMLKGIKLSAGLITEKDAGEKKIFDFIGGYGEMKSSTLVNQILLGDYTLEFGQGITLWSSLSFSKGNDAVSTIKKSPGEIDSYTSVNEIQFFRGGASNLRLSSPIGNFNFFGFYSNNYFDAAIDTLLGQISTIYYDGYHRTNTELNREHSAKEKLYGGRIVFDNETARLGVTYYRSFFDKSFKAKDIYDFTGNRANAFGADYDLIFKNINLFGEWARSYTGAIGGVSGARIIFFSKKMSTDLIFLVRNYPKDFIMLHSYGFGEQSGVTQNEFGIYSGIKFKIPGLVSVDAYLDQYKFPYRTFFKPVPTEGRDLLVYTEWKLSQELSLYTKYKNENKENVITVPDEYGRDVEKIFSRAQSNYRIQFDYDISKTLRLRSRFEYDFVDYSGFKSTEKGLLFYTDFRIKPFSMLIAEGRFIIFHTDSYDSRVYEYENELDGAVYNPPLYGKGRRWYLIVKLKPLDVLQFSAKYSETYFDGVASIGSGNDEIMGNFKNRLSLQLDVRF